MAVDKKEMTDALSGLDELERATLLKGQTFARVLLLTDGSVRLSLSELRGGRRGVDHWNMSADMARQLGAALMDPK
jgi:hypothetical protein